MLRTLSPLLLAVSLFAQTKTVQIGSGQTVQLSAPAVVWSVSPPVGTVSTSGLYQAPASNASQQTVLVTASAGGQTVISQSITLLPDIILVTLPIEVGGLDGTTVSVPFMISPTATLTGLRLSLQVHNIKYENEASVKINDGAWTSLNSSTLTLPPKIITYGGIGGGFNTFTATMPMPGTIVSGPNVIAFRFNGTNSVVSEFRVLAFNVNDAGGNPMLPPSTFVQDDPSKWTAPLNTPADVAAGKILYQTQALTPGTNMTGVIKAHCMDCHTQDGRDLKYFNYSNYSIRSRSMFHGLTAQQGDQIASYIRSLNTPAPASARPWNPPYQPGPGMDSKPVSEWAAGAGIAAVLANDSDELPYVLPNLAYSAYLNQRETPICMAMKDWNNWLPSIHPMDVFSNWSTSEYAAGYVRVRAELAPGNATLYGKYYKDLITWQNYGNRGPFLNAIRPAATTDSAWQNPQLAQQVYSFAKWQMVKLWEVNQEYGLEGMASAAFGAKAESRAWYTNQAFLTAPAFLGIPVPNPGLGNGSVIAIFYDNFIWYHLQLLLNDGNGTATGTWPIDRGYTMGYLQNSLTWDPVAGKPRVGTAGLIMEWFAKIMQSVDPNSSNPYILAGYPNQISIFSAVPAQKVALMNQWVTNWLAFVKHFTVPELAEALILNNTQGAALPPYTSLSPGSFTGDITHSLPILKFMGVDPGVLSQVAAWASGVWPTHNFTADLAKSCSVHNGGEIKCP